MRYLLAFVAFLLSNCVSAQDSEPKSVNAESILRRGLDFLAKDAIQWKNDHNCASCHHAALTVWALQEAKFKQRSVDEEVLSDLKKWMTESGEGKTSVPRPEGRPKALNTKAVYFALALASDPEPNDLIRDGLTKMLNTVKDDQLEDGSWHAWPNSRPPFFGPSDEIMSGLATLAASSSSNETIRSVRDRGVRWLAESKTDDDPQSLAIRLIIWTRIQKPEEERRQLIQRIEQRQKADGGWSQSPDMESDAWATGQAMYALTEAGMKPNELTISRGKKFLMQNQKPDGSWPMTSRPIAPGGAASTSLIPIIGAGSAWAVMGLVRAL